MTRMRTTSSCVGKRQRAAQALEHVREDRNDEDEHRCDGDGGHDQYDDRVGQRGLDRAAQLDLRLEVLGDRFERTVEESAGLTGPNQVDHDGRKVDAVLVHRIRERHTGLNIPAHRVKHLLQLRILGLLGEDVEGAQQRKARADHGRHLPAHDREILHPDALAAEARDADLAS